MMEAKCLALCLTVDKCPISTSSKSLLKQVFQIKFVGWLEGYIFLKIIPLKKELTWY